MSGQTLGALYVSLFVTGLAGSLHCVGMCGPILLGLQREMGAVRGGAGFGFLYYHAGRLWTYGLLGFATAWAGSELAMRLGWQQPLAVLASLAVIACGAAALGWIPGLRFRLSAPAACAADPRWPWLAALVHEPRPSAKLLLGAVMGLLPCGLVYAALAVAATLPGPVHGALAMLVFGAGTLPALSALLLAGRLWPRRLRFHGTRLAAAMLLGVGIFMLARALWMPTMHGMH